MQASDIKLMIDGLTEKTKDIIIKKMKTELGDAINAVNKLVRDENAEKTEIYPPPTMVLAAFRLCQFEKIRVIVLGQDPFINPGEAMGLSFSVPRGKKIPPSTQNIYKCLLHNGLVNSMPEHGDLTSWAKQGILLLNCALTVFRGQSNSHAKCWAKYTDTLLSQISELCEKVIFIMLGNDAKKKSALVNIKKHIILEWGHPSPLNPQNKSDNSKNFIYCDAFSRTNILLKIWGQQPINWNPNFEQIDEKIEKNDGKTIEFFEKNMIIRAVGNQDPVPPKLDILWVFTDGAASANGHNNCVASWAFYITDGTLCAEARGLVPLVDIPGVEYKTSNIRGELTGILRAVCMIAKHLDKFSAKEIIIVTDSKLSIDSIDEWYESWIKDPKKLANKKNIDLIGNTKKQLDTIRANMSAVFQHVRSHQNEPEDIESVDWFYWKCNDIVDNLCNKELRG